MRPVVEIISKGCFALSFFSLSACSTLTKPEIRSISMPSAQSQLQSQSQSQSQSQLNSPKVLNTIQRMNASEVAFEKDVDKLRATKDSLQLLEFGAIVFGGYTALFTGSTDLAEASLIAATASGADSLLDYSDKMKTVSVARRRMRCALNAALNVEILQAEVERGSPITSASDNSIPSETNPALGTTVEIESSFIILDQDDSNLGKISTDDGTKWLVTSTDTRIENLSDDKMGALLSKQSVRLEDGTTIRLKPTSPETSESGLQDAVITSSLGRRSIDNYSLETVLSETFDEKRQWENTVAAVWGDIRTRFNNDWDGNFTDNTDAINQFSEAIKALKTPTSEVQGSGEKEDATESTINYTKTEYKESIVKLLKCPLIQ